MFGLGIELRFGFLMAFIMCKIGLIFAEISSLGVRVSYC
jgi:hypothetical protein